MRPFQYQAVGTAREAVATGAEAACNQAPVQFLAGGTTLIDLMRLEVMQPERVADISPLAGEFGAIEASREGLRIGALATMAEVADHEAVARDYPALAQSLLLAASTPLRNMASMGGNLLQRTRCLYFRDPSWEACNKREPGSGCAAREGVNRDLAIFGVSEHCIANYPGDLAVALVALDASIEILGANGSRTIRVEELHRLPGDAPHIETVLEPGDLITAITIPAGPMARRSLYLKIRDRESYQFGLVTVAVGLDTEGGKVRQARIAFGGIGTKPWRSKAAEGVIIGKGIDEAIAKQAGEAALADAWTGGQNAFKAALARNALVRALLTVSKLEI
jgi:xanthine dehydrogenase YagS FAD-binding subunit